MNMIRESKEYLEFGYNIIKCPVCGNETLDNHYICPTCGWEYDGITEKDIPSSSNGQVTINEYLDWLETVMYGEQDEDWCYPVRWEN